MARSARSKGLKDERYKEWIRSLVCLLCKYRYPGDGPDLSIQLSPTEAAHVGPRGLSQKCSDRETLPLCVEHHREGKDAHHVLGRKFWEHHGLDRDALIAELNARYEQEKAV